MGPTTAGALSVNYPDSARTGLKQSPVEENQAKLEHSIMRVEENMSQLYQQLNPFLVPEQPQDPVANEKEPTMPSSPYVAYLERQTSRIHQINRIIRMMRDRLQV